MLKTLVIDNIALIRHLEMDFTGGFQVLTGETGAGKSILIESIGLLTGTKADKSMIRTGTESASVTGVFGGFSQTAEAALAAHDLALDPEGNLLVERSFSLDGKSKCKINGSIVTLGMLRDIAKYLIDIHGQTDTLALYDADTYIEILDRFAGLGEDLTTYRAAYETYESIRRETEEILKSEAERTRTMEMLAFQIADIDALSLKPGEDTALEEKEKIAKNYERISKQTGFAWRALKGGEKGNVSMLLDRSEAALKSICDAVPTLETVIEELRDCRYRLDDLAEQVHDLCPGDEDPTEELNRIEERLTAIARLKRKYGGTVEEILAYRKDAKEKYARLENADSRLLELREALKDATAKALSLAEKLHEKRAQAAEHLSKKVVETLVFLDMPKVTFRVSIETPQASDGTYLLTPRGYDTVDFLISANSGEQMQSLSLVASGGELARMMLALKSVENAEDESTAMVFDEIDTGVSGKTARKIGMKLLELSRHTQIFCVTHSAQIASLADVHFLIAKHEEEGRTVTVVSTLDEDGRIRELSRILGGIHVTEAQIQAAVDMRREKAGL